MITLNTSRILVPFDFSTTSKKALRHAALLAQKSGGEVQLLYVREHNSLIGLGHSTSDLRQFAAESEGYKKTMEKTAAEIRHAYDISVKTIVGQGKRIPGILSVCKKNEIGVIVMGTDGAGSVSNLFSKSNSRKVVSRTDIPVITVRSGSDNGSYANILVPIDLSEHSRQKMVVALRLAKIFGAKIHLLALYAKDDDGTLKKLNKVTEQISESLRKEAVPYTLETLQTAKPAARTLSAARKRKADLIIAMTDQGTSSSFLGHTSYDQELIDESSIPVLSIPPELKEEELEKAN